MSVKFGLPAGIKGVFISFNTVTTVSANDEKMVGFFPSSDQAPGGANWKGANGAWCQLGNGKYRAAHGYVPCDSNGDIYFATGTSGSDAFNIWVCILAYAV